MISGGDADELREVIERLAEKQQQLVTLVAHNMATLSALAWHVQSSLPPDSPLRVQFEAMLRDRTIDSQRVIDSMGEEHPPSDSGYWDRPQPE